MTPGHHTRLVVAATALVGLIVTACAADDPIASTLPASDPTAASTVPPTSSTTATIPETTTTEHAAEDDPMDSTRREHQAPQPRLVMIEADTGMIQVLDIESGETVARFESAVDTVSPGEAPSTSGDGRFVFFSHYSQDRVTIVDSGTWTERHGSHGHHFTDEPKLVGTMEGPSPSHVVNHEGVVAVFFDGEGRVTLLDEKALSEHKVEVVDSFTAGGPHHGVTVPFDGCFVSSLPSSDASELPDTIGALCDGSLEDAVATCPDLHGESMLGASLVFACADGLRRITIAEDGWAAEAIPYPAEVDDEDLFGASIPRAWGFQGADGASRLIAWAGTTHLFLYDDEDGSGRIRPLRLPSPFEIYGLAVVPRSESAVVLTTDGVLHLIDLEQATVTDDIALVAPFEPDLSFTTPHHYVVATSDRAYVLDPPSSRVVEIHIGETLSEGRTFDLVEPVAQVALTGGPS